MIATKQQRILEWLKSEQMEECRTDFANGNGFVVTGKVKILQKDGSVKRLLDILLDNEFTDKMRLDGYEIRYSPANAKYPNDAFRFFLENPPVAAPDFL